MKIAVIDVETTGLNPVENRITEIGMVLIEDNVIVHRFDSLINPEITIPSKIKQLTGIDDNLLKGQPVFAEIAAHIQELTEDHLIVGHHVNFDYSFLKNEMKLAGYNFTRKTLCTAELGRFLFSNLNSYSLSSLARFFKVVNRRPHRALPDAEVTAEVFLKMIEHQEQGFIGSLIQKSQKSNLVPSHLKETVYQKLPQKPGVYYFIGKNGKPLYIGKAANLRSRVLSHFRGEGNSLKILALGAQIKKIDFRETGNELIATLLEDHEIRHYWPVLNRAQKKNIVRFGVVTYIDQFERWRFNIAKSGKAHFFMATFHQYHLAFEFIRNQVHKYRLDGRLCGINEESSLSVEEHNRNFMQMIHEFREYSHVEIYFSEGRDTSEKSFIWIENESYKGIGFIHQDLVASQETLESNIMLRISSVTSESIIKKLREQNEPSLVLKIKKPRQAGFKSSILIQS